MWLITYTCITCRFHKLSVADGEEEFKSTCTVAPLLPAKEAIQAPRNIRVIFNINFHVCCI